MKIKRKKVIVAMSGGVDSSVAAALLKKQGYDVIGVFMRFWAESGDGWRGSSRQVNIQKDANKYAGINKCCSFEAYSDARQVANKIGIPLYTLNLKVPFKKWVVNYFLKEYHAGRTPNPCVECNRFIKFGELLKRARAMGADYIATGHYARLREIKNQKSKIKNYLLLKGVDKEKDQSYFLYTLTQDKLKHILFPIGEYTKSQVRQMAKKWGLPVYAKSESQEVCFVGTRLQDFLKRWLEIKSGKIVELETGKVLGRHGGLPFYTIGQRKGLGLSGGPWYVVRIDTKRNALYVSRDEKKLLSKELTAEKVNWISGKPPKLPFRATARIRYKHKETLCTLKRGRYKNVYKVIFDKSQRAVTPGQSVVFYRGEEVLGGGIIKN